MSVDLIEYYWDYGVYDIYKMCELVEQSLISEDDFKYITGLYYKAIKEQIKKEDALK